MRIHHATTILSATAGLLSALACGGGTGEVEFGEKVATPEDAATPEAEEEPAFVIKAAPTFDPEEIWVEWHVGGAYPGELGDLMAEQVSEYGLTPEDQWWILPEYGPAVAAKAKRYVHRVVSECGGDSGLWVELEADIGSRRPLAFAHGEVPPHWSMLHAMPKVPRDEALAVLEGKAEELAAGKPIEAMGVGWDGETWFGEAAWLETASDTDPMGNSCTVLKARISEDSAEVLGTEESNCMWIPVPVGRRDVDGDGSPDTIIDEGGCNGIIKKADGSVLARTTSRCCF
jgi:hypothetical protein